MKFRKAVLFSLLVFPIILNAKGKFTAYDYKYALWMATRYYGGQRSGIGPNWLIMEHDTPAYRTSFTGDADGAVNLEGGWFDCGDHVTFGQTFFFSAYMLAKAYDMFPEGYHDLYHGFGYNDYMTSKNWDIDGGELDGVPDLVQELKYATDWIIKATPDGSTFYYQKGEGAKDHKLWVTAGKMSTMPVDSGGEPRKVFKNPDDGVMASFAAAALAVMSRIYRKYDPEYAEKCLTHAGNAYNYAKPRKERSAGAADGGYYGSHSASPVVAFITAASEMFATTGEEGYKNDAVSLQDNIKFHNWGLDYANTHDLAAAAMATSGIDVKKLDLLKTVFLDQYTQSLNSEGVCTKGNSGWGALRYPANHAFVSAIWAKTKNDTSLDQFIYKQIDYILGANNARQSFIVGFCSGCLREPKFPHHRNVYLRDDNPTDSAKAYMTIPERNRKFGSMVGGTWNSSDYKDDVNLYSVTEGGIDYNAGLVGALGYIVSKLDPADTSVMVGVGKKIKSRQRSLISGSVSFIKTGEGLVVKIPSNLRGSTISCYDYRGRLLFRSWTDVFKPIRITPSAGLYAVWIKSHDGKRMTGSLYFLP